MIYFKDKWESNIRIGQNMIFVTLPGAWDVGARWFGFSISEIAGLLETSHTTICLHKMV